MSRFYVLPPRSLLGDHLAGYLACWLPGLAWDSDTRENLTEAIRAAACCLPGVYLVFRDELPAGISTSEALRDAFGAEEGDEVIEVRSPSRIEELPARRWEVRNAA